MTKPNNIDADKARVSLPLTMLITAAVGLLTIGGSHVANAAKVDRLEEKVAPVPQEQRVQDLRIQRLEDKHEHLMKTIDEHVVKSLDEIKAELKEMRRAR